MIPDEATSKLKKLAVKVSAPGSDLGGIMLQIATTMNSKMKQRIIETGYNAEGVWFGPYSTYPMLTSRKAMTASAYDKVAGSKKKRKELKWVTLERKGKNVRLFELEGGYKQFRDLHDSQTGFTDFAFSGRMWSSVQVVSSSDENSSGLARISTLSEEQMKKLEGHTERKGMALLDLSDKEVNEATILLSNWLDRIVESWWL